MVGVGGLVVNDKDQILTITEKQAIIPGAWKLPGGYVEPSKRWIQQMAFTLNINFPPFCVRITDENFIEAAIREVEEETGIKTTFDRLVCIRHAMGRPDFSFNCSDLYIVIALTPETSDIRACEREINACEWMNFSEYLEHPKVHEMNRGFLRTFIDYKQVSLK